MGALKDDYVPPARRGLLHFSSLPTNMRPNEVRELFSQFGPIVRQRFVPYPKKLRSGAKHSDASAVSIRHKSLMPLQMKYGYLEFQNAKDAQHAANTMNNTAVHCKRRRKCYGQLWNCRYLPDQTWDDLVDEREGEYRSLKQREAEARREERSINETFRRLVMARKLRAEKEAACAAACESLPPADDVGEAEAPVAAVGEATKKGSVKRSLTSPRAQRPDRGPLVADKDSTGAGSKRSRSRVSVAEALAAPVEAPMDGCVNSGQVTSSTKKKLRRKI